MSQATKTDRRTDPRIETALQAAIDAGEVGIQVAAYLGGELVVDAWAGQADRAGTPVNGETLFAVFSSSKAMITAVTHIQAERGLLDLDQTLATYWPEYAAYGKEAITVRHVLTHRAGVPQMPSDVTSDDQLADWAGIIRWLEQVVPSRNPGERSQYHGVSIYYLLGEVLRRTDPQHRMFDELLLEDVCAPLGIKDLWFRVPAEHEPRVAELTYGTEPPPNWAFGGDLARYEMMCPLAHRPTPDNHNRAEMHRLLSGNLYATARDGARFWSLLANGGALGGVRLLSEDRVAGLAELAGDQAEVDEVTGFPMCFSTGLQVGGLSPALSSIVGSGPRIVCHTGGGGTLGWADLDRGLSVMYTHNRLRNAEPFIPLAEAVRAVAADHR